MSRSRAARWSTLLALPALLACAYVAAQGKPATWSGIGRAATQDELRAWDIDVRPDFKGLPAGSGSVARGQDIWEAKCASCHGVFGESNEVFPPVIGGTTKKDMQSGRVEALAKGTESQRSTMMKLSTLSTLWDYIHRAMPWNNPRTLSADEVYAVTAYILNLADVLPADFTLSDANIRSVQAMLPNRNGKSTAHGLWLPTGRPDVRNTACMRNCADSPRVASSLPDHARGSHGNLYEQTRNLGATRGQKTGPQRSEDNPAGEFAAVKSLTARSACLGCHGLDRKLVGPGFSQVAEKYRSSERAETYLAQKIRDGGAGVWGDIPMPASAGLNEADALLLARWILKGTPE